MFYGEEKDDEALALEYPELTPDRISDDYSVLCDVLMEALGQVAEGKGKERHATAGVPFEEQVSCTIQKWGLPYAEGQAVKKIVESVRLPKQEF